MLLYMTQIRQLNGSSSQKSRTIDWLSTSSNGSLKKLMSLSGIDFSAWTYFTSLVYGVCMIALGEIKRPRDEANWV
ncbi:hypothetical protein L228DRAFT_44114 [Xylona heveae TC161]|uniref:Uncharacterized protein n=1 Tax=Xylona heveae (strain CBS 132557 / TC161) TaxID=1328760 RepID=A0A164ZT68_XYLHT|nr:hypothetical protein L228DRAFT_44114 [Xylona heveae TC161]KZF19480.1 hypothetical protein L228DRAFT_44114 [Xylona heveae TC161]